MMTETGKTLIIAYGNRDREDDGEITVDDRLAHAVDVPAQIGHGGSEGFENPDPVGREQ